MKKLIYIILLLITSTSIFSQPITWQRTYGTPGIEVGESVVQTPDSGFIAVGRKDSYAKIFKTNKFGDTMWSINNIGARAMSIVKTSDNNYAVCDISLSILKFDIFGNIIFYKNSYNSSSQLLKIIETYDKGFIIVGRVISGYYDYPYLLKVDSLGNLQWHKVYWEITDGIARDIVQTSDSGYAFTGDDVSGRMILRIDKVGNIIWQKHFGNGNSHSIILNMNNGFVIGGMSTLTGTDTSGNIIWEKTYYLSGNRVSSIYHLSKTFDKGYIITGYRDTTESIEVDALILFLKTDSLGNEQWNKLYGFNTTDNWGNCVLQTNDSGYIITGITDTNYSFNGDFFLIKTDKNGYADPPIGIEPINKEIPNDNLLFQNYPNPFNPITKIEFLIKEKSYVDITIYNPLGSEIFKYPVQLYNLGKNHVIFNGTNFSSGIYFYQINVISKSKIFTVTKKMILLK